MKGLQRVCLFLAIIFSLTFFLSSNVVKADVLEEISAKSAILVDANTGQVLFEKNSHDKAYPASVTKIMTLLLTMEAIKSGKLNLDDKITITADSAKIEGTKLFLDAGEVRTVEDLVYGVAVESGNDASNALGVHIGGSLSGFVDMMNERASQLGMNDTHFANTHGLHEENHYTSAYDVALMSRALLKHEEILKYSNTWMIDVYVGKNNHIKRTLANTNKLIRKGNVDGLKTGYTIEAGHCISATGKENELRVISVIMGGKDAQTRFDEAEKLLNHGFSRYQAAVPARAGDIIATANVYKSKSGYVGATISQDIYQLVEKGHDSNFTLEAILDDDLVAPLNKGDVIGKIKVSIGNNEITNVNAICSEDVPKSSFLDYLKTITKTVI
ncbi:MAG: D-alanyl-D-alanine carboxypeptidase [Eubacteriaceae bacterium]|nr:D-alanyl-D-alanine carboxypeptidase [Eubacteriaceae bacterium]